MIASFPMKLSKLITCMTVLITTDVPYANNLDLDETPSNLASHPDPSCLILRQHFHQLLTRLKHFENSSRREA